MQKYLYPLIILFSILFYSCQSSDIFKELGRIELLMVEDAAMAMEVLEGLFPLYDSMTESEKAYFGLLYFTASDKINRNCFFMEMIDHSIDYYTRRKNKNTRALSCFYKARTLMADYQFQKAAELLLEARRYADQEDYSLLGKIYFDLGTVTYHSNSQEDPVTYYELATHNFDLVKDYRNEAIVLLTIADYYRAANKYEEAEKHLDKALDLYNDPFIKANFLYLKGKISYEKNEPDSAKFLLNESLGYLEHIPENQIARRYLELADIYLEQQMYDSAKHYADIAMLHPANVYNKNNYYRIAGKVSFETNDITAYNENIKSYYLYRDSITRLESQPAVSLIQQLHTVTEKASKEERSKVRYVYALLSLVLITVIIVYYMYRCSIEKHKLIEREINKKLERKHNLLYQELIGRIQELKDEKAGERKRMTIREREISDINIYKQVLLYDKEDLFFAKMNRLFNKLPDILMRDYPAISNQDIMWCCLFLLNFSSQDMALILGKKQETVRKQKQRIAKK